MIVCRAATGWFALAVVGHAAALRLVDAGPRVHYQHYFPLDAIVATRPWLLLIVVVQAAAVTYGLSRRWAALREAASQVAPPGRLALALALTASAAAVASPAPSRYLGELGLAASLQLLSLANLAVMALAVPASTAHRIGRVLDRLLGDPDAERPGEGLDRFSWTAAVIAFLLAAALSLFSYDRHPHVPDEVAYLLHARYFADGLWTLPALQVPMAFNVDLMHYQPTRWFSPVPPGWPAVLAVGVLAGAPWLVNPLLGAANVLLAASLLRHLYPRRVARCATVLIALSPWCLFLAMSWMTDTITLTCALAAALGVVRARRTGTFTAGLLSGVAVGATSLVRPLSGVIVALVVALWAIGVGGRRLRLTSLSGLAIGSVAIGGLVLPYNQMLTGRALTFPINAYSDAYHGVNSNAYGFGADRGMGWPIDPNPGHSPVDGLINAHLNVFGLNTDLFGWSTGSLLLVALVFCRGVMTGSDRLMVVVAASVFIAHFFYYFSGGSDFGARYWFLMVVPLAALSARGIQAIERGAEGRVGLALCALLAMTIVNYVPWRAVDKYRNYRGMSAGLRALAEEHGFAHDLVLVRGERFPDYASAIVQNPINLHGSQTIYAWDPSDAVRAETLRAFPGRRVWIVDGPTRTGSGYRVVQGPVSADALAPDGPAK